MATRFQIFCEVITDEEDLKVQKSFDPANQKFTYTPIIQREELDTGGDDSISLNFTVADIADISSKNAAYSKTITLPASDRNRRVFKLVSELGTNNGFNAKRYTKCYVMVESVIVLEGYIQLSNYTSRNGKYGEFQCTITALPVNFFNNLGDLKLQELDWSTVTAVWNQAGIKDTWDPTKFQEYFYPLMDPGMNISSAHPQLNIWNAPNGSTYVENFYPGVYLKSFVDRIFATSGYRYKSNFFSSDAFAKMLIPYNGSKSMPMNDLNDAKTGTLAYDKVFSVGRTNNIQLTTNKSGRVNVQEFNLQFNTPINPYNDPLSRWSTTTNTYKNVLPAITKMRFTVGLECYSNSSFLTENDTAVTKIEVFVYRELGQAYYTPGGQYAWNQGRGEPIARWVLKDITPGNTETITAPAWITSAASGSSSPGFYIKLESQWLDNPSTLDNWQQRGAIVNGESVRVNVVFHTSSTTAQFYEAKTSYFLNEVSTETINGGRIDFNQVVPQNVRCQDLMKSLINMFNLHIEASKEDENTLIIEPREEFFELGTTVDWSDKVDLSQDIKLDILANTQARRNIFTMKDDKDFSNVNYKAKMGETYGTYTYDTGSQYQSASKTIESIFSPSPLVVLNNNVLWVNNTENISGGVEYPGYPTPDFKATNMRLLFVKKRQITRTGEPCFKFMGVAMKITPASPTANDYFYPYAGPLDDIYVPNYDLNFGQAKANYYGPSLANGWNVTNNNLFNLYWSTFMQEVSDKDSRLVSMYIKLDPQDVARFSFSNKVFIRISHPNLGMSAGGYFKVNSIEDYNPSSNQPCIVRLLKTDTVALKYTSVNDGTMSNTGSQAGGTSSQSGIAAPGGLGGGNNGLLGGGSAGFMGAMMTSTPSPYEIDGGMDMVGDEFSNTEINTLDGGLDAVRGLGSYSTTNEVNGGLG